jgi:hypothetical protein
MRGRFLSPIPPQGTDKATKSIIREVRWVSNMRRKYVAADITITDEQRASRKEEIDCQESIIIKALHATLSK